MDPVEVRPRIVASLNDFDAKADVTDELASFPSSYVHVQSNQELIILLPG